MSDIKILDACCGSRLFWFDKNEPHTTFMDVRQEKFEMHGSACLSWLIKKGKRGLFSTQKDVHTERLQKYYQH